MNSGGNTGKQFADGALKALEQVSQFSEDLIFIVDRDLTLQYANSVASSLFGFAPDQIKGRALYEFFTPDTYKIRQQNIEKVFQSACSLSVESRIPFPEREMWFDTRLTPILDGDGAVTSVLAIARDITESKAKEELILRSKQEWLNAIDKMPALLAIVGSDYRIRRVNRRMADKLGMQVRDAVGLTCYEYLSDDKCPPPYCPLLKAMSAGGEYNMEVTAYRFDEYYSVSLSSLLDHYGAVMGCIYTARQIMPKPGSMRKGGAYEEYMKLILRRADYLVGVQNVEGKYLFLNALPEYGHMPEEFKGKTPFDFIDPASASRMIDELKQVVATGRSSNFTSEPALNGERLYFINNITPIRDAQGQVTSVLTISKRLSEPRQASWPPSTEPEQESSQKLTRRESEILQWITAGLTNAQIAEKLFISINTVETHRTRLMRKLDVRKTPALVKIAMERGIF